MTIKQFTCDDTDYCHGLHACDNHMTYMWVHKHPLSTSACSTASVLQFVLPLVWRGLEKSWGLSNLVSMCVINE